MKDLENGHSIVEINNFQQCLESANVYIAIYANVDKI